MIILVRWLVHPLASKWVPEVTAASLDHATKSNCNKNYEFQKISEFTKTQAISRAKFDKIVALIVRGDSQKYIMRRWCSRRSIWRAWSCIMGRAPLCAINFIIAHRHPTHRLCAPHAWSNTRTCTHISKKKVGLTCDTRRFEFAPQKRMAGNGKLF